MSDPRPLERPPLESEARGTPAESPLAMPVQALRRVPRTRRSCGGWRVRAARALVLLGTLGLTAHGVREMLLAVGDPGPLQILLVVLFGLTFGWIAFAASAALAGLLAERHSPDPEGSLPERTALVMPVYNEDPVETAAGLESMARSLIDTGHADRFELWVLSDTHRPEVWIGETAAIAELRRRLGDRLPVWYRRRYRNTARKAGNVEDFVTRFGGRYEAFVLLDADSLMEGETIVRLARAMAAEPDLGLLQTFPRLVGGRGLWARLQQFAGAVVGPVVARGVAAWQGHDGNYWGHNAIIRTRAFAQSCGLPMLRGPKPIGGHVLSHDFVEAALLRRRGWTVRMDPGLLGSFEASPPTLLDVAQRDRRWAQGNLQHAGILGASGLAPTSRFHLALGIASYLASPLWLALIVVGLVLAAVANFTDPVYFESPSQLFPNWPRFDRERLYYLFRLSLAVLLLPRLVGIVAALGDARQAPDRRARRALLWSSLLELLVSSLYAPILMLMQSRQILEILRGKDSGWSAQSRGDGLTPWRECFRRHVWHTLIGGGTTVLVAFVAEPLVGWMAPTLLGLTLSIWLSRISGSDSLGARLRARGLLVTAEERHPPAVVRERDALLPRWSAHLRSLIPHDLSPEQRRSHFALVEPLPERVRGEPDVTRLTTVAKCADATSLEQAWSWLTERERLVLLSDEVTFDRLAAGSHAPG